MVVVQDGMITLNEDAIAYALELFDFTDWDKLEAELPDGIKDTSGTPVDRNNRNIRLWVLAGAVGLAHGEQEGPALEATTSGMELMNNPAYEQVIESLLNAYDRHQRRDV